jgi:G3E family GTPase
MHTTTVTLLSSCYPLARERVLARLHIERPRVAVVRHELATLATQGCVHRVVRTIDGEVETTIGVEASCCLSCLLRDDTLAALDETANVGADQVVLVLPVTVEASAVADVLAGERGIDVGATVTVIEPGRLEDDLRGDDPAPVDGVTDDPRSMAEVLALQLETADVVVRGPSDERASTLIAAMAPRATRVLESAPSSAWLARRGDLTRSGRVPAPGVPHPRRTVDRAGIVTARWSRRRPFHASRLIEAFEDRAVPGLVRARGHLWVATRPATLLELEATSSGLELAAAGAWLEALRGQDVTPDRRRRADAIWHPYWGDRASDLALVLIDHPPADAFAALDRCLLTDEELSHGEVGWRQLPDPLDGLGPEADHLATLTRQEAT